MFSLMWSTCRPKLPKLTAPYNRFSRHGVKYICLSFSLQVTSVTLTIYYFHIFVTSAATVGTEPRTVQHYISKLNIRQLTQ